MLQIRSFTFNPASENTYLLHDSTGNTLIIDPGCYFPAERENLHEFIRENRLKPVQLLNTHCHLDHIFGNKWVHDTFGLELFLHPDAKQVLDSGPQSGLAWGLPFDNYSGPLHFIGEGDTIETGGAELEILAVPGHSPGSIAFYCSSQHFLVGGDVLFYESIGRTDLEGGDHDMLLRSIREKLFTLPDKTIVYPGHGQPTSIGHEKKHNPFLAGH